VGGTTTKYFVDDKNPTGYSQVMDEIANGAVTRTYTYGRQLISENQFVGSTWTPSFYGYDGHGNARFLANAAGTVTDTYTFDAFGAQIAITGSTADPYLYSGERFDSSPNLYHLRARYYNALTGRFETMDPYAGRIVDPGTLHKYVYTKNNPVNAVDPSGRGVVENVSIRAWIFTQITVPLYLSTPQGKAAVAVVGYVGLLAADNLCELLESVESLVLEPETVVKGPGLFCNTQPDEPEPNE